MQRDVEALTSLVEDLFLLVRVESGRPPASTATTSSLPSTAAAIRAAIGTDDHEAAEPSIGTTRRWNMTTSSM